MYICVLGLVRYHYTDSTLFVVLKLIVLMSVILFGLILLELTYAIAQDTSDKRLHHSSTIQRTHSNFKGMLYCLGGYFLKDGNFCKFSR